MRNVLIELHERDICCRRMCGWLDYSSVSIPFEPEAREQGESRFTLIGLTTYAIRSLVSFTSVPLQIVTAAGLAFMAFALDRKSTRLNSSHVAISSAVFCLKKIKSK